MARVHPTPPLQSFATASGLSRMKMVLRSGVVLSATFLLAYACILYQRAARFDGPARIGADVFHFCLLVSTIALIAGIAQCFQTSSGKARALFLVISSLPLATFVHLILTNR